MIRFWSKATRHAFEQAPSLSLDLEVLSRSSLAWAGATAPGLELAIADMLSSGELVQRSKLEVLSYHARFDLYWVYFLGVGRH